MIKQSILPWLCWNMINQSSAFAILEYNQAEHSAMAMLEYDHTKISLN